MSNQPDNVLHMADYIPSDIELLNIARGLRDGRLVIRRDTTQGTVNLMKTILTKEEINTLIKILNKLAPLNTQE